jgi:ABC-type uncharacterized transport system substrate-binding protein
MRRRAFIAGLAGSAAWPLAARAQQQALPVIGFLDTRSPEAMVTRLRAWRQGLQQTGYIEGENVTILYRWAEGNFDRLPELAADLVRRKVGVIASGGGVGPAQAVKAATAEIPVVFAIPEDPVRIGLVASLSRPGGNLTGVNFLTTELAAKRLELLRELVPSATRIAVIVNHKNPNSEPTLQDVNAAASVMKLDIRTFRASTVQEIDLAFAMAVRERPDAFFLGGDSFFLSRRLQIATLPIRHALPSIFSQRDFVEVGGLMSYSADVLDAYRQSGIYVGRILHGAKTEDLPVLQSAKFELVINNQIARTLAIKVPASLLARADEVIE